MDETCIVFSLSSLFLSILSHVNDYDLFV